MGPAERKQLFANIVRLRRAERDGHSSPDLVAVQADLERQLGATVSRSLAAGLLDVSHTALNRWIATGDIPTVITPAGRRAVPVYALLDLFEAVEAERAKDASRLHVLEPVMSRARQRAQQLRTGDLVDGEAGASGHRPAELRSLAYHRALAKRLDRPMVETARRVLRGWRETGRIDHAYGDAWEALLSRSPGQVARAISQDTAEAAALRQSSPFAGMLSEPERQRIIELVR